MMEAPFWLRSKSVSGEGLGKALSVQVLVVRCRGWVKLPVSLFYTAINTLRWFAYVFESLFSTRQSSSGPVFFFAFSSFSLTIFSGCRADTTYLVGFNCAKLTSLPGRFADGSGNLDQPGFYGLTLEKRFGCPNLAIYFNILLGLGGLENRSVEYSHITCNSLPVIANLKPSLDQGIKPF